MLFSIPCGLQNLKANPKLVLWEVEEPNRVSLAPLNCPKIPISITYLVVYNSLLVGLRSFAKLG